LRLSMEVMPPTGSIQSCSPSASLSGGQGTQKQLRTDEGYGDFQCCDPVHQRHACMGARSQYMRWKPFEMIRKHKTMRLTNAVFTRTLCKGNVRDVVMHITRFVFIQGAKAARRVLLCRHGQYPITR
jgi:hypothetical protein